MSALLTSPPLLSRGLALDLTPAAFGWLRESNDCLTQPSVLSARLREDGYLFIRDFFARDDVLEVRRQVTDRLQAEGALDSSRPPIDAFVSPSFSGRLRSDLAENNPAIRSLLFGDRIVRFYESLFGGPVRHYDYVWFRAIPPGPGTKPHCDIVYMGRGTRNQLTAWVPYGDIPREVGGLMILEDSHRKTDYLAPYLSRDVDTYCENGRFASAIQSGQKLWEWDGNLTNNPVSLREKLGGRWLTAEAFRPGDLLTFGMSTVHASLDNASRSLRFSSDTRYQLASEPIDERWIGDRPIGHSVAGKRGRIC